MWWGSRSSSAPVRRSDPNTSVHSSKGRGLLPNALAEGWLVDHQVKRADRQGYCKCPQKYHLRSAEKNSDGGESG